MIARAPDESDAPCTVSARPTSDGDRDIVAGTSTKEAREYENMGSGRRHGSDFTTEVQLVAK